MAETKPAFCTFTDTQVVVVVLSKTERYHDHIFQSLENGSLLNTSVQQAAFDLPFSRSIFQIMRILCSRKNGFLNDDINEDNS